jgi:hypothetical protein
VAGESIACHKTVEKTDHEKPALWHNRRWTSTALDTGLSEAVMTSIGVNKRNVGRIAERIVSNELEYRGFQVSDLNKEGTSSNADLLAAKGGRTYQIQVKGATWDNGWWWNYGFCNDEIIDKKKHMFNSCFEGFYQAQIVVLASVKSPTEYQCLVLPTPES